MEWKTIQPLSELFLHKRKGRVRWGRELNAHTHRCCSYRFALMLKDMKSKLAESLLKRE